MQKIIAILLTIFYLIFMVAGGIDSITGYYVSNSSQCGNNVCEEGESVITCDKDCIATCGDNICEAHEKLTCAIDCIELQIEKRAYSTSIIWLLTTLIIGVLFMAILLMPTKKHK